MRPFFSDDDFSYLTAIALGATYHQAADVGEVVSAAERIRDRHARSWIEEWTATADRLAAEARANADGGHPDPASRQFLRASMYYWLASGAADRTSDASLLPRLWEKHRSAWDRFVDLTSRAAERIWIPYDGTTLPGYFFRAGPAGRPMRTLVLNNGSSGPVTTAWVQGIAGALDRGWNAMTFDGPGQNAALLRQGLPCRPDWENVITPVIDYLLTRPDVAPGKIALLGVGQGGYWVPRSAAFEHRITAVVADPGVVDVAAMLLSRVSHHMMKLLDSGRREEFDSDIAEALKSAPSTQSTLAFRMRPYGTTSPFDFFTAARQYTLADEVIAKIGCPVLVTDPENEEFWPGQSQRLYGKLTGDKALVRFTEEEGAGLHCEPAAAALRGERIFSWLDRHVPA